MITVAELEELKAMHKRMAEIMSRIEAVVPCCRTCGHGIGGHCAVYQMDIPTDSMDATCERWEWSDIPF